MPGSMAPSKIAKHRGLDEGTPLAITSLMDMMTIILVFLLKTFSTQGDLSSTAAHLTLPTSDAKSRAGVIDRVAVGRDVIYYMDKEAMVTADAIQSKDIFIKPLLSLMETRVQELEQIYLGANRDPEPPKILILADRTHYFSLVKRVVATAAKAGYMDISLAAIQGKDKY